MKKFLNITLEIRVKKKGRKLLLSNEKVDKEMTEEGNKYHFIRFEYDNVILISPLIDGMSILGRLEKHFFIFWVFLGVIREFCKKINKL
mgnify:CR=1 FL=1